MNLYDQSNNINNSDHKSILHLPMFCRLSLKDVKENCHNYHKHGRDRNSKEPSSPRVSCIGQVKRNNRVISPNTTMMHHHQLNNKHMATKPRKSSSAFTSKTLLPNATNMLSHNTNSRTSSRGCRSMITSVDDSRKSTTRMMMVMRRDGGVNCCDYKIDRGDDKDYCVDLSNMDPPLPVVKRLFRQGRCEPVNIWKRRFNGDRELKTLKIEHDTPAAIFNRPPTTV